MIIISFEFKVGELVISTAGRDTDRYFIIVEIVNDSYIKIADGDLRKLENPKLKNIKHVRETAYKFENLALKLKKGQLVRNEKLKKLIKDYLKDKEE